MTFTTSVNVLVAPYSATANDGTNDTAGLQAAVDACPAGGTVYIPAGTFMIDPLSRLDLKSDMNLNLASTAILKAIAVSSSSYEVVKLTGISNVTITSGKIEGERVGHIGSTGEWGHGISVLGSDHVTITGTTVTNCWGDGFYIGANGATQSTIIRLTNVIADNNRRQECPLFM